MKTTTKFSVPRWIVIVALLTLAIITVNSYVDSQEECVPPTSGQILVEVSDIALWASVFDSSVEVRATDIGITLTRGFLDLNVYGQPVSSSKYALDVLSIRYIFNWLENYYDDSIPEATATMNPDTLNIIAIAFSGCEFNLDRADYVLNLPSFSVIDVPYQPGSMAIVSPYKAYALLALFNSYFQIRT